MDNPSDNVTRAINNTLTLLPRVTPDDELGALDLGGYNQSSFGIWHLTIANSERRIDGQFDDDFITRAALVECDMFWFEHEVSNFSE